MKLRLNQLCQWINVAWFAYLSLTFSVRPYVALSFALFLDAKMLDGRYSYKTESVGSIPKQQQQESSWVTFHFSHDESKGSEKPNRKKKLATRKAEDLRHMVSPVSWPKSCFWTHRKTLACVQQACTFCVFLKGNTSLQIHCKCLSIYFFNIAASNREYAWWKLQMALVKRQKRNIRRGLAKWVRSWILQQHFLISLTD